MAESQLNTDARFLTPEQVKELDAQAYAEFIARSDEVKETEAASSQRKGQPVSFAEFDETKVKRGAKGSEEGGQFVAKGAAPFSERVTKLAASAVRGDWTKQRIEQKAQDKRVDIDELLLAIESQKAIQAEKREQIPPKELARREAEAEEKAGRRAEQLERERAEEQKKRNEIAEQETRSLAKLEAGVTAGVLTEIKSLNMLEDRTPRQLKQFTDAAISWQSADPSKAAIDFTVQKFSDAGIKLEQRGRNYSWYGTGPNGEDIRVGDHLGFESHEIDILHSGDNPPRKDQVEAEVTEILDQL